MSNVIMLVLAVGVIIYSLYQFFSLPRREHWKKMETLGVDSLDLAKRDPEERIRFMQKKFDEHEELLRYRVALFAGKALGWTGDEAKMEVLRRFVGSRDTKLFVAYRPSWSFKWPFLRAAKDLEFQAEATPPQIPAVIPGLPDQLAKDILEIGYIKPG